MAREGERPRVVFVFGSREELGARVERVIAFAGRLDGELLAAFVEDTAVVWSAALPFTRAVSPSGGVRPLEPELARRALRLQARELRARFLERTAGNGTMCRFVELTAHRFELALERRDIPLFTPEQARALIEITGRLPVPDELPTAILGRGGGPIVAFCGRSREFLERALWLAGREGCPLVLVATAALPTDPKLERQIGEGVEAGRIRVIRGERTQPLLNSELSGIIQKEARLLLVDPTAGVELDRILDLLAQAHSD